MSFLNTRQAVTYTTLGMPLFVYIYLNRIWILFGYETLEMMSANGTFGSYGLVRRREG